MSEHPAVIEAGPAGVRRLCCSTEAPIAGGTAQAAITAIDDAVTLVDDRPISTEALWCAVLQSLIEERHTSIVVVYPSWWSAARVAVIRCAAAKIVDDVVLQRRSELLAKAALPHLATTVVEITDRFVAVTGAATAAERRTGQPHSVAERIARVLNEMTSSTMGTVLIDAPTTITGAGELATEIADRLHVICPGLTVLNLDDDDLCRLAAKAFSLEDDLEMAPATSVQPSRPQADRGGRRGIPLAVGGVVMAAVMLGAGLVNRRTAPPSDEMPTAFLVEGRIALTIPSQWSMRRVVDGPGSARVQVSSPADPEIALHVTQSPVADQTLSETAESLKRAIGAEASGVFVDFNPSGHSAGRPAVTYREVRPTHDVQWSVLLDGAVRISIGCQSRRGAEAAVREVCDLAVRSAHALS